MRDKLVEMDGNYNYRPKPQPRGPHRRSKIKDRGSKSYTSSEDEEFHSDDNLRPYEEVKVAHHDKKLNGLGLTANEHALTADEHHGNVPLSNGQLRNKNSRLYSYMSGSDGDNDDPNQTRQALLNVHHQGSQCSISSNEIDNMHVPRNEAVSQLSLSDDDSDQENFHQSNIHRAATAPVAPPCLPNPPPPPPIEDIPQRMPPACMMGQQRAFGPSHRGNYSDAESCVCSRHYADAQLAMHQHRGHYSDLDNPNRLRHCPYSEGESDFEPHYLEQTASGNVFIPDGHPRFPRTVPRSGSVPMSRSGELVSPQNAWPPGSNTVPQHFVNGENHNHVDNRHAFTHPHFGCQQAAPLTGYPGPMSQDYYTKFSSASHRMKKHLRQRCSWKCTAVILVIICVALLACTAYFAAMLVFEEKERVANDSGPAQNGALNSSRNGAKSIPNFSQPSVFHIGDVKQSKIQPRSFWKMKFRQEEDKFIKFNFSIPSSAILGVYARRNVPPSIAQFDFFEVFDGSTISSRYKRSPIRTKRSHFSKDTALIQYMEAGTWYIAVFNDREDPQYISFKTDVYDSLGTDCPKDCHGHGDCYKGRCRCFPGYTGWDCSQNKCPVLCNGNGVYIHGSCRCHEGWKGQECEVPVHECEVPNCNNNGRCLNGQCVCHPGFNGPDCGFVDCLLPNCSGNGICHLGNCVCYRGFKGSDCSIPDKLNVTQLCARDCSGHGTFDFEAGKCLCERFFDGPECETEICRLECYHGHCENQKCICEPGWGGALCDQLKCDDRCDGLKGMCDNGTCVCRRGWNGKHCTLDGCPDSCSNHGTCRHFTPGWMCDCTHGWKGEACNVAMEMQCKDGEDNDRDGIADCLDPDCCLDRECADSNFCQQSPDPLDILLRKQPPSPTASFYDKMRFLIEENSVQIGTDRNAFSESQVSLIRGRVVTKDGTSLIGVRIHMNSQPLYGYTSTRMRGMFDILVNGGGSVHLEFTRQPYQSHRISVLVPWNQILTIDTVVMVLQNDDQRPPDSINCGVNHDYYNLQPVVLSTWQHTQLGACPEKSTIIPESQVVQESLLIPSTDIHLVYHSSETAGYMSVILIQMTPDKIPPELALVHLKVSVQGIDVEKTFEADPGLKYTFSWDRKNAFRQKVYGIVPARVHVGYQYKVCNYVYWEIRSTTMSGYDLASSQIGGWNLDVHHTYNYQEGILHKGDGTNIYLKEKPKKLKSILGNGYRRKLDCEKCNGHAKNNRLLAPVALASGRDGSLYVWDHNYIRKLSPERYDIASILKTSISSTSHKPYMTVSPVDGHLYVSDYMKRRIIRVATMGPVRNLESNFIIVVGRGEECTPGALDKCGDGKEASNARLVHPKGIAISKEGIIYIADNLNIRRVNADGIIDTVIGSQGQPRAWEPMSCENSQPAKKIRLQWPTDLAIDPLDDTLHILDKNIILKLTKDERLITVAGRPLNCPFRKSNFLPSGVLTDQDQATSIAADVKLVNPQSIAFGPQGEMYIVESDSHSINRVRVVTTDGHIHHLAGTKSKCDCQTMTCKCYNAKETLAAQALFKELMSITVTPDGIVHIADGGNLRVFSVLSELPTVDLLTNQYEVVSPETHEVYIFNHYGQHRHTVNIMTNQYVYNFTYNVNSFYGKLRYVEDDVGNKIEIVLDRETLAKQIISPDRTTCDLVMDNIRRLQSFQAENSSVTFTYSESTGLLQSKYLTDGRMYTYKYDEMGRLLQVGQPTGEITRLTTDVNTTGSIVHITTDNSDAVAMATYGSVQSVMHVMTEQGVAETKVTYLPNGAVIVVFPSNLSISIESAGHPILANEHRMHFKRKVIAPNRLIHKLEWRYYLRRKGRTRQSKVVERIGHRMRVGAPFSSRHARMHDTHDDGESLKGKDLMINGENLLTVEYDRETHTEVIMGKGLKRILSILYDGTGQPTYIKPANGHHALNISYSKDGRITHWQYGEIEQDLVYESTGLLKERLSPSSANALIRFRYRSGNVPTDVILPNGLQYILQYDHQGFLWKIRTPGLGEHYFSKVIAAGLQRFLYWVPELGFPYVEEYDGNGKLRQIIYPSETKRVIYRYNNYGQMTNIIFDETEINIVYDPQVGKVAASEVLTGAYDCKESYHYTASLVKEYNVEFARDRRYLGAKFTYSYDQNFRITQIRGHFRENLTTTCDITYDENTGKLKTLKSLSIIRPVADKEKIYDGVIRIDREYDSYGRLQTVKYLFGENEQFSLNIGYDLVNRIHHWNCVIGQKNTRTFQYLYDVNGNVVDVLLNGKPSWRYSYDNNGNINKAMEFGQTRNLEYDVADKIVISGPKRFRFDQDGFMVQRHDENVVFNSNGQLMSITKAGEYRYFYSYDAMGRLVIEEDTGGFVIQYFYGDVTNPTRVTHSYNQSMAVLTQYFYDTAGKLLALKRRNVLYYVATDPMGSPLAILDSEGSIVKERTYDPLGQLESDSNPNFDLCFGFQGGLYNLVTQLVMFGKRLYDTDTGHWLSPDYSGLLQNLKKVPNDPMITNTYQNRFLINTHSRERSFPMLSITDWLMMLGFDIRSLAPDVSYTGEIRPKTHDVSHRLLPMSSAFECTFLRDMDSLLTISTVPKSKVSPLLKEHDLEPTPKPYILGRGVTLSVVDRKVDIQMASRTPKWASRLAEILKNKSEVIDLRYNKHGRDIMYMIKTNAALAEADLKSLGIHNSNFVQYETNINITINRIRHSDSFLMSPHPEVDVRIHGKYSVINIRYGTTYERERQRILGHAKEHAVNRAWKREKWILQNGLATQYRWSEKEKEEIQTAGQADGYEGHYIRSPEMYPELSDDCNNIRFTKNTRR